MIRPGIAVTAVLLLLVILSGCKDRDIPPAHGLISFDVTSATVAETAGSIVINIGRGAGNKGDSKEKLDERVVSVDYRVIADSAQAEVDYIASAGTFSWSGGEKSIQSFSINILDDSVAEGDETFTVVLENVQGGAALGYSRQLVTITDDESPGGITEVTPPSTYQFYWQAGLQAYTQNVFAVDPDDNSITPVQLAGSNLEIRKAFTIEGGTYDSQSKLISGRHVHALLLVADDQKLYRLDAIKQAGNTLTPVQVSNATVNLLSYCLMPIHSNYDDEDATTIVMGEQMTGMCFESDASTFTHFPLNAAATDAPSSVTGRVVASITDSSTGSPGHHLIINGSQMYLVDAAFQNAQTAHDITGFSLIRSFQQTPDKIVIMMNNGADEIMKVLDITSNTLSSVHTAVDYFGLTKVYKNGDALAFFDGSKLYNVDLTASTPVASLILDEGSNVIMGMMANNSHVVYNTKPSGSDTPFNIKTVIPDSSSEAVTLATLNSASTYLRGISDSHVFYHVDANSEATAGYARLDGTDAGQTSNARWAGVQHKNTQSLAWMYGNTTLDNASGYIDSLFKVSGMSISGSGPSTVNGTVTLFSADSNAGVTPGIVLGTLPYNIRNFYMTGYGNHILGKGWRTDTGTDILAYQLDTEYSQSRLTNTGGNVDPVLYYQ